MNKQILKLAYEMQEKIAAQQSLEQGAPSDEHSASDAVPVQDPDGASSSQLQKKLARRTPRVERYTNEDWIEIVKQSTLTVMRTWMQEMMDTEPEGIEVIAKREAYIANLIDYKAADGNKFESWPYLSAERDYWHKVEPESPEEVLSSAVVLGIHVTPD